MIDIAHRTPIAIAIFGSALALVLVLTGCAPLVVGGAAVAGASAIHDRRPPQTILDDRQIEFAASQALFKERDISLGARVTVTSYNRNVLLTGQAESADLARRASALVSRQPKVARVIDEIRVGPRIGMGRQSEDLYTASRAKLELASIDLPDFDPTRVKIVVEDGVLYLLGLVTPREGDAAVERVRHVPGVRKVIKLFEYWSPNA